MVGNAGREPHDFVVAAHALLEYAVAVDDVLRAVQALTEIGRAAEAHGWGPFLDAPGIEADEETARLRDLVTGAPLLLAKAAAAVAHPVESYGAGGVAEALYARSGYQVLLDRATWDSPELTDAQLEAVDAELVEAIDDLRVEEIDRPAGVPASHAWWSCEGHSC